MDFSADELLQATSAFLLLCNEEFLLRQKIDEIYLTLSLNAQFLSDVFASLEHCSFDEVRRRLDLHASIVRSLYSAIFCLERN